MCYFTPYLPLWIFMRFVSSCICCFWQWNHRGSIIFTCCRKSYLHRVTRLFLLFHLKDSCICVSLMYSFSFVFFFFFFQLNKVSVVLQALVSIFTNLWMKEQKKSEQNNVRRRGGMRMDQMWHTMHNDNSLICMLNKQKYNLIAT